ncbi:hypothetical protein JTE90_029214 [Oedothorax gibbosus]|uniref:Uncharacterized protein n=1 Tax=Oedothorax gibbosus TaxID=931172 RepID=A0AAV6VF63_9ARAC|nr:hypothetical protein JTE90_029214 [Oedothorax gibbosus]
MPCSRRRFVIPPRQRSNKSRCLTLFFSSEWMDEEPLQGGNVEVPRKGWNRGKNFTRGQGVLDNSLEGICSENGITNWYY